MRRLRQLLVASATLLVAPLAASAPPPRAPAAKPSAGEHAGARAQSKRTAKLERPRPMGRSVGSPTDGHLIGGARIEEGPHLRIYPVYAGSPARWGLESLVQMIDRAGRSIKKQHPDAVLSVGHLSRPGGGEIDRHASHESGRDADVGFYVKNQRGKTIFADHMVAFKADGTAPTWPGAQFDDAKNWALVAAFASDTRARVTHIFVAAPLRARLLQYAAKIGAPPAIRTRAAELMAQPRGSLPHDDHFHVRIACPPGMSQCVEQPVARRRPPSTGKGAVAASPAAGHGAKARVPAPKPVTPKPASPSKPEPASDEPESKSEAFVPNLAPMIPGLDTAIIPAPLAGLRAEPRKPAPAEAPPIDDPDGVLEPLPSR